MNGLIHCLGVFLLMGRLALTSNTKCEEPLSQCFCGQIDYLGKSQYVLNCTNLGFTNASVLEKLPQKTQVLIFVGNSIPKLPRNFLGVNNNTNLRVIDMSNNNIREILGQTFHHVPKVERLILNHNEISIAMDEHHPRVFSNFQNLLELHLTNAFADNTPDDLASDLHDIFNTSELTKLRKLHLEQNEIRKFKDPKIFCELTSLMDLHLGDNKLQHVNFKFDCLHHLRFMGFERNEINSFKTEELAAFDLILKRHQNLTIDISENPLICGPKVDQLYTWLQSTNVEVRNKNRLKCTRDCDKEYAAILLSDHEKLTQTPSLKKTMVTEKGYSSSTVGLLTLALLVSIGLLIYTNRNPLKAKVSPIVQSLSRKVHYTNIGKPEAQEMDV